MRINSSDEVSILIVDDDREMLETLGDTLQEKGYRIDTARTGKEALKKAEGQFFNIALVDIKLQDMTGIEILRTFREKYSMMEVIITGNPTLQNVVDALNLGAIACIMKPIDHKGLDQTIRKCLEKQKLFGLPDEVPAFLRKPEIRVLLEAIRDEKVTEFKPSISYEKGVSYPEIERMVPDQSTYYRVFEVLEKYGIVRRKFHDSLVACPSCGSLRISIRFRCPSCGSTSVGKHTGILLRCNTCGKTMSMAAHVYVCGDCKGVYSEDQLNPKEICIFVVSKEHKPLINRWIRDLDDMLEAAREFYREVLPPYDAGRPKVSYSKMAKKGEAVRYGEQK